MSAAERAANQAHYIAALGRSFGSRAEFNADLRRALRERRPFAAGRLSHTPQYLLSSRLLDTARLPPLVQRTFAMNMRTNAELLAGIFPGDEAFRETFVAFYLPHVHNLDWLGLTLDQPLREVPVVQHYDLRGRLAYYQDFVPEKIESNDEDRCYLRHLAGQRLLLICPFARVLQARATQATFEAVWAKTGKPWFHPAAVEALEVPYGFEPETQRRFGTVLNLYEQMVSEMSRTEFDVALIAAAGLAIPLASAAKQMGKIAIDLGGDLQILFGVTGSRWLDRPQWREKYYNPAWITVPEQYQPSLKGSWRGKDYW